MSTKGSRAPVNKILSYVKPFVPILPEIEKPKKKVELKERLLWTLVVLFVYLVCCQVPPRLHSPLPDLILPFLSLLIPPLCTPPPHSFPTDSSLRLADR
jgi:hypothetical protein